MIEKASISSAKTLAEIHIETINEGFLSQLGVSFLKLLYKYLIRKQIVLIALEKKQIIGFVSFSYSSKGIIKRFILSNPQSLFIIFYQFLKTPSILKPIFETIKAPKSSLGKLSNNVSIPEQELLSISVITDFQKSGIGNQLLMELETLLKNENILTYKVIAGDSLIGANKFYTKNGFYLVKTIVIHGNSISNVYVKSLTR